MSKFSESTIRAEATSQSYERGASYYRSGAVSHITRRGNTVTAQVEGSEYTPYGVTVTFEDNGDIDSASCTCPYDWGGYCKHIVAVLLAVLNEDDVSVRPEMDTLLAGLTDTQLRRVLKTLVEEQPLLAEAIEREVQWLKMEPSAATAGTQASHGIAVDLADIRRQIQKDFRHAGSTGRGGYRYDYWEDEGGEIDLDEVLGPHLGLARRLIEAGDPSAAADVIAATIEEYGAGMEDLDEWLLEANEYGFDESALELGALLAEALLSQDLSKEQRAQWQARVEDWGQDLFELEIAETALEHGWDYPPLAAALQGNITERGAWEDEAPDYADELALVRLRILERQGRLQEYLNLAEAEGQISLYVNMLARSGQVERAVAEAKEYLVLPSDVLSLAQVLVSQGQRLAALAVAAHGLGLPGQSGTRELARWTVDQAQQVGDSGLALAAAQVAFLTGFDLDDYKNAESLAGPQWPAIKPKLLKQVQESPFYSGLDIYLYEDMLVEAMAVIDRSPYSGHLMRVVDATRTEYPDWGIQKCKQQAERIMDAGKAKDYSSAVSWLRTARDIYVQHNRQAEWQAYLNRLLELHGRKYKLVPLLRGIR